MIKFKDKLILIVAESSEEEAKIILEKIEEFDNLQKRCEELNAVNQRLLSHHNQLKSDYDKLHINQS